MIISLFLLQAAPDLEIGARVRAKTVTIEQNGRASLTVQSEPAGDNVVDVRAPQADGQTTLRNVTVDVRAEARIAGVQNGEATTQPR